MTLRLCLGGLYLGLLVLGCGPKTPPVPTPVLPEAPILPAPEAPRYATGSAAPRDALGAAVGESGGLDWQESLAGGATTLVLGQPFSADLGVARWAAVRAGYPHPVAQVVFGEVPADTYPTPLLQALQPLLRGGEQVGIVRARQGNRDRWVALISRPLTQLSPLDRELRPGDTVELVADRATEWHLLSPSGHRQSGPLPGSPVLREAGEWWLELRSGTRVLVSVPLYVGMRTPPTPAVPVPGRMVTTPSEALTEVYDLLNGARAQFDLGALAPDDALESLARWPLAQGRAGQWDRTAGEARLRAAGFVGGPVGQLYCAERTVALCLDALMGSLEGRSLLLGEGMRIVGAAAEVRTDGVAMALNLTSE